MTRSFIYSGPSMNPLFQNADFLRVEPYQGRAMKVGDVIVFRAPTDKTVITHRIAAIKPDGVITRGDNCPYNDQWLLRPEDILGKVIYAKRGDRDITVHNGRSGRIIFLFLQFGLLAKRVAAFMLRPGYRLLARLSFIRLRTSLVSFKRPSGVESQLRWGKLLVARKPADKLRWWIRPPFKIFIDEARLP